MGCITPAYRPRDAEHTVLHQVIAEHLETFLGAVAEAGDGAGLPQFVEREFREFLLCGVYEAGVARFQCEGCAREHLVPFSCKGRGWCPSCGGRRMMERAAHLVDEVLPGVPVRQWVLTVPYRLRYQMAWNHGLSRAVLRVYTRVLGDVYRQGARTRGIDGGQTGMVTALQRAGGALNMNVHFHTLVLDGVFSDKARQAAPSLGVKLVVVDVRDADYDRAFVTMVAQGAGALFVVGSPLLHVDRKRVHALAAKHRIPAIYDWRENAEEGGLMAYGGNLAALSQRVAEYVDRILKGAQPADLPVEQATKFELVINLQTAKALGLTIPPSLLARADQVIE